MEVNVEGVSRQEDKERGDQRMPAAPQRIEIEQGNCKTHKRP